MNITNKFNYIVPILFVCIFTPIIVNVICSIQCDCHVGKTSDWINFFGSFLGSVFTICGSLWIFYSTFKKDKIIRDYNYRVNETKALSIELGERITRLHLEEFSKIAVDIQDNKMKVLDSEQKKQLLGCYYKIISDKKTFEIKYGKEKSPKSIEFKNFYYKTIDSIINIVCFEILNSNNQKIDGQDLLFLTSIADSTISKGLDFAIAWVDEKNQEDEQYKEKYGI